MAQKTKSYVAEVLKDLSIRLAKITPKVYVENRPESVSEQLKEFIVISFNTSIRNRNPYQKSYVNIEVYMKKKANGVSNTLALDTITNKILVMFPIVCDRYTLVHPTLALKGDDQIGFNIWNINAKLIINSLDSYN